ncbi:MAG: GlcG/HbpS family heme-binding protein [Chloroflexota bacterium]
MPELNAAAARAMCDAAMNHAQGEGWRVSVAVLDAGGHVLEISRMDGCNFLAPDIARGKAYGAAAWKIPSADLSQRFGQIPSATPSMVAASGQRVVLVQGALPVWAGSHCVGAIGVSGVRSEQDEACARAGLEAAGFTSATA